MDGGCVLAETELVWPDWKLLKGLKGQCVYCIQWNKDNASCLIRFITHCICVAWKWVFWIWKSYWPTVLFLLIVFGAFSVSVQTKALSTDPLRSIFLTLHAGVLRPARVKMWGASLVSLPLWRPPSWRWRAPLEERREVRALLSQLFLASCRPVFRTPVSCSNSCFTDSSKQRSTMFTGNSK